MFFLAGAAASSALDLVSSLQQALGGGNSSAPSPSPFDPTASAGASAGAQASAPPAAGGAPASPLSSSTLNALFSVQAQGQGGAQQPLLMVNGNALSQQMFSLLDGNGDGAISQSEFDTAFGQNGNTTQANSLFAKLDTNSDGSVNLQELTNALGGGDDAQGQGQTGQAQGVQGHHHHHHHGGGGFDLASLLGGASGSDGSGSGADGGAGAGGGMSIGANAGLGADLTGDATQSVTNSDGSTTTTVTYADGSKVAMTIPGANSSGQSGSGQNGSGQNSSGAVSAATFNNFVEQMIQRQAQLLASTSVGQSLAVSA
jgi:hypothetical protein